MAQVNPFNPGGVPNLAVGTPGVQNAPGQAFRTLAAGIGQVRQQLAQAKMAQDAAWLHPLAQQAPYLGAAIGRGIMHHEAVKQQQINALGTSAIADNTDMFGDTANQAINTLKQSFVNNPQDAPDQLKSLLDDHQEKYVEDIQSNPLFKNNPVFAYKMKERIADVKRSAMERINDWSLTQSTTNAKAYVDNVGDQAVDSVEQSSGSLADKMEAYQAGNNRVIQLYAAKGDILGRDNMAVKARNVQLKLGTALFNNVIADVPDDPMQRLAALHNARQFLDLAQVPLPPDAHKQFQTTIDARISKATGDLINQLGPAEQTHDLQISEIADGLKEVRYNADAMNSARNFVETQTTKVKQNIEQTNADPTLPDKAKVALNRMYAAQLNHLGRLYGVVNSQSDQIASADRREANAQEKAARRAESQGNKAVKASHKTAQDAALMAIFNNNMKAGQLDPRTQADQIQLVHQETVRLAKVAYDTGLISLTKFYAIAKAANSGAVHAAVAQTQQPNPVEQFMHSTFGLPLKPKPLNTDQKAAARAQATKGISDAFQDIHTMGVQHKANQSVDFSPAEQAIYDKKEQLDIKRAKAEHWTDHQLHARLNQRRQSILAQRGAGQYRVPPPPPYYPSIVPEQ